MTATQSLSAALADRYEIERLIGEGGMATVYLARDLRHNRRVALKVLRPDLGAVFLAYGVPEARLSKTYIAPFPNPGNVKWLVSPSAGIEPVWSNSGEELFYRDPVASTLVAVPVHTGSAFSLGAPKVLFPAPGTARFAVSRDDSRFLMVRPVGATLVPDNRLMMIENWVESLSQKNRP